MELSLLSDRVMHNGQTHATYRHATKNKHKLFFGNLAIQQLAHNQFSKHTSPTIMHSNQTTYQTIVNAHNCSITWGKNLTMILPRSWEDLPNFQDHGHDPPMWDLAVQILHWWYSHMKYHLPKQENRIE